MAYIASPLTMLSLLSLLSVLLRGLFGAFVLPGVFTKIYRAANRRKLQSKVAGQGEDRDALFGGLLRNGISPLRFIARLLLRNRWVSSYCKTCVRALATQGRRANEVALCELLIATNLLVAAFGFLLTGTMIASLFLIALVVSMVNGRAKKTLELWERKLIEQIPDTLRSFGICFHAGFSLQQAFEQTARDTPDPLGSELRQASYDVNAGRSIEEALSALEARVQAPDLRFALVALEIQHRTGGALQELLENAAESVTASHDLQRQLAVATSQARLSAKVVTILPLLLVVALSLTMDGYLQAFFSSSEGLAILFAALGMEAIGVLVIRRILGVELG